MNPEQLQEFERDGLTCMREAVDGAVVEAIRDRLWEEAERRRGIARSDPTTWQRVPPALVKKLREDEGLFDPLLGPGVCVGIDALLGSGNWQRPKTIGQLLMSPPDAASWVLPHKVWHTDFPAPGWVGDELPGVQLFLLLERLEARGGGTLFVGGSHRLMFRLSERQERDYEGHSAQLRKALARNVPWLRDLWREGPADERYERFMAHTSEHEGVPLRVLEATGEPGDVFFMHPWLLHDASPNCGERMRMVATERIIADGVQLYTFNRPAE